MLSEVSSIKLGFFDSWTVVKQNIIAARVTQLIVERKQRETEKQKGPEIRYNLQSHAPLTQVLQ
jgi:hypothetical protein